MATLHDGITVLGGSNSTKVIGLTATSSENNVIVTKDRAVDIYKVGDTKALMSWSAKSSSQFTSPVIFNNHLNQFIGVYNQKSIVRWHHETTDLLKLKTVDVGSEITTVLNSDEEPFVVFSNGWVEGLSSVVGSRKGQRNIKLQTEERLINYWLMSDQHVVLLAATAKEYCAVVVSPTTDGGDVLGRYSLRPLTNQQSDICDACIAIQGDVSSLYILWSDGSVMLYKLDDTAGDQATGAIGLPGQIILQLPSGHDMSKVRIASIRNNFLAISGVPPPNDHKAPPDCAAAYLTIWNTTFGTVDASVPLTEAAGQSEEDGVRGMLFHLHDHLFVAAPSSLTCHPYQCESISLAQALGKLSVSQPITSTGQWGAQQPADTPGAAANTTAAGERVLKSLLHPDKVNSRYKKDVQHLQTQSPSTILEILKAVSDKYSQRKEALPQKLLQPLIKSSRVAGSACPEFLSTVLLRSDVDLALLCIESMHDIPEPFLAQCLQLFLSLEPDTGHSAVNGGSIAENDPHSPVTPKQALCINKVLVCPFNTIFLLAGIKKLRFSSVLLFLRYLDYLLVTGSYIEDDRLSEEALVDWVSVTLDAHFTQLVLTPAAKDVLTSLQKCVHQQAELYAEVKNVRRMVEAMEAAAAQTVNTKNSNESEGTYSVEILELPV